MLLACIAAAFTGGVLFLLAPVSHTQSRWSPFPCWLLAAAGVLGSIVVVGRANQRDGLPFFAQRGKAAFTAGFRDLTDLARAAGIPVPLLVGAVVVGEVALLAAMLHAWSAAFTH